MSYHPWEELTEHDVKNIKSRGNGCFDFVLSVAVSVIVVVLLLKYFPQALALLP